MIRGVHSVLGYYYYCHSRNHSSNTTCLTQVFRSSKAAKNAADYGLQIQVVPPKKGFILYYDYCNLVPLL